MKGKSARLITEKEDPLAPQAEELVTKILMQIHAKDLTLQQKAILKTLVVEELFVIKMPV